MSLVEAWTGVGTDRWRQGGGCTCVHVPVRMSVCMRVHVCVCVCVCLCEILWCCFEVADGMIWLQIYLKEHSSKQATSFFYVSVSLVLWSGNHLDGRKIGHCKLKLDNLLFCFGQSDHKTFLSIACFLLFQGYEFRGGRSGGRILNILQRN